MASSDQLSVHQQTVCVAYPILCNVPGCNHEIPRGQRKQHEEEFCLHHNALLMKKLSDNETNRIDPSSSSSENLLRFLLPFGIEGWNTDLDEICTSLDNFGPTTNNRGSEDNITISSILKKAARDIIALIELKAEQQKVKVDENIFSSSLAKRPRVDDNNEAETQMRNKKKARSFQANNTTLRFAVKLWCCPKTRKAAEAVYGPIGTWDTSSVTSMRWLFTGQSTFNDDISTWDVSQVTDMLEMFTGATSFNQPLNNWKVHKVTTMRSMFSGASQFNQPLDQWQVGNVTEMYGMFQSATLFNQPLNSWDMKRVESISWMFSGCQHFNQPLEDWKLDNVTDISGLFSHASTFNQPLNHWNVSKVTYMCGLFSGASAFNQPLHQWDVHNVESMSSMFQSAIRFNQPLDSWDIRNVKDMSCMFRGATNFKQSLDKWDLTKVSSVFCMFEEM